MGLGSPIHFPRTTSSDTAWPGSAHEMPGVTPYTWYPLPCHGLGSLNFSAHSTQKYARRRKNSSFLSATASWTCWSLHTASLLSRSHMVQTGKGFWCRWTAHTPLSHTISVHGTPEP